jgi:hypothetical protein
MHGGVGARSPTVSRQSITQDGGGEASRREPLGGFDSLLVDDHAHIAPTRNDEQRDAVVGDFGSVEREQGLRDVLHEAVAHRAIRQALDDFFMHPDLVRPGRAAGPQRKCRSVRSSRRGLRNRGDGSHGAGENDLATIHRQPLGNFICEVCRSNKNGDRISSVPIQLHRSTGRSPI